MRINTNVAALNSYNQLNNTQNNLSKSLSRLSSGKRINGAADDAAGLAISEKMGSQTRGLAQAQRNAQDGISMIQTAEGALKESHSILQRMRELAVQSANDTNTEADRGEIQKEVDQLAQELTRIGETTEFNTQKLLDGTLDDTKFQIGANEGQNMEIAINDMRAEKLGVAQAAGVDVGSITGTAGAVNGDADTALNDGETYNVTKLENKYDIGGLTGAQYALTDSDNNVVGVSANGKDYIEVGTGNTQTLENIDSFSSDATDFEQTITFDDAVTDGTVEYAANGAGAGTLTAEGTKIDLTDSGEKKLSSGTYTVETNHPMVTNNALLDSNGDVVATDGGSGQTWSDLEGNTLFTVSATNSIDTDGKEITVEGGGGIDVSSQDAADNAISTLDDAIANVSAERSKLGAVQNRLDHTINNLNTAEENLTAAESRISDVDMAKEMMNMSKQQILSQAGTAMMAQANQLPQGVLQLLG